MKRFILKAIGIMCGTSKDGIDAVIIKTNGNDHVKITAHKSIIYSHIFL